MAPLEWVITCLVVEVVYGLNDEYVKMKRMKKMSKFTKCMLWALLAVAPGCTHTDDYTPVSKEEWQVALSRSTTNNENVRVSLTYGTNTKIGELIPASEEGGQATWATDKSITWPGNETGTITMKAFSPVPADRTDMPTEVSSGAQTAYLISYKQVANGGESIGTFTLTHLMAQLQVHILLEDEGKHHYQPTNAVIRLHTTGEIDYPGMKLNRPADAQAANVSLGTFAKETVANTDTSESWKSIPQIVVPQTLPAGECILSFTTDDGQTYTFTSDKPITLVPGRQNHLYLGVAMNQPDVYMGMDEVIVTDWDEKEIQGGEAEEELK